MVREFEASTVYIRIDSLVIRYLLREMYMLQLKMRGWLDTIGALQKKRYNLLGSDNKLHFSACRCK
jgi:hypothetical protein